MVDGVGRRWASFEMLTSERVMRLTYLWQKRRAQMITNNISCHSCTAWHCVNTIIHVGPRVKAYTQTLPDKLLLTWQNQHSYTSACRHSRHSCTRDFSWPLVPAVLAPLSYSEAFNIISFFIYFYLINITENSSMLNPKIFLERWFFFFSFFWPEQS